MHEWTAAGPGGYAGLLESIGGADGARTRDLLTASLNGRITPRNPQTLHVSSFQQLRRHLCLAVLLNSPGFRVQKGRYRVQFRVHDPPDPQRRSPGLEARDLST